MTNTNIDNPTKIKAVSKPSRFSFKIGYLMVVLAVIITCFLWVFSKSSFYLQFQKTPFTLIGQLCGLLALVLFTFSFIFATRTRRLEAIFGGLDKLNIAHAWVGATGFLLALFHPIILLIHTSYNTKDILGYFWSLGLGEIFGSISLGLFILLISLTLYSKFDFKIWKILHTLLIIPYSIIGLHLIFINFELNLYSANNNSLALWLWIWLWYIIGIGSFVYKVIYVDMMAPKIVGTVVKVHQLNSYITQIDIQYENDDLIVKPGQYCFLSFPHLGYESHPFGVVDNKQNTLTFLIKSAGDYTNKIKNLVVGDKAYIDGGYGFFGQEIIESNHHQIWIAGGIGVVPFLSILNQHSITQPTDLIYCLRNSSEAVYLDEIEKFNKITPNLKLHVHYSDENGFVTVEKIAKLFPDTKSRQIFMCTPPAMNKALLRQFEQLGLSKSQVTFEEFSFRN